MYHWVKIFDSEEALENNVPLNGKQEVLAKGKKIIVVRTTFGYTAVRERCPHNGASLSGGFCTPEGEIVCPLHRYRFSLITGKSTSGGSYALETYPLAIKPDGVFLGIKAKWWEL
jgi:nitrite reductase/ring-hydroxylating ferredoxin subunit